MVTSVLCPTASARPRREISTWPLTEQVFSVHLHADGPPLCWPRSQKWPYYSYPYYRRAMTATDLDKKAAVLLRVDEKLRAKLEPVLSCHTSNDGESIWSLQSWSRPGFTLKDAADLLTRSPVPISVLRLSNPAWKPSGLTALAAAPGLASVTTLGLRGCNKLVDDLSVLVASPHLAGLRSLELPACALPAKTLEQVRDSPVFRLTSLDLSSNALKADGAAIVGQARAFAGLRALAAGGNQGFDAWADALATTTTLTGLEVLQLPCFTSGDSAFGPTTAGLARLAGCDRFTSLQTLNLMRNDHFDDDAAAALAGNAAFAALREIDLSGTALTRAGFLAIATSPHLKLRRVVMSTFHKKHAGVFAPGVVALVVT